jgi:endosialidase-like protein
MKLRIACVLIELLSSTLSLPAQTASTGSASTQVPPLIQFSNVATDEGGNTLSGVVNITFSLYTSQQGGEALWIETQNNVPLDPTGHYSVQLGVTKPNGVPTALFTTGEARWLGVQIAQQPEQPRVLLLSVPYALKAGDATTIGGLPPSAFVLAAPATGSAASAPTTFTELSASPADALPASDVTGAGTIDFIPLWTTTANIGNSVLFQSGSGTTAKIGINSTTPATTLDVKGAGTIRGPLSLPATGVATATKGANSQPFAQLASAFNSASGKAVTQTFDWQAEPAGNDTSSPSGTLNLLYGSGTSVPAETGLHIASDGQITFATGQIFPGTGDGTLTGITTASGSGLTGGGTSGTLNLGLKTCSANQVLQYVSGAWTCSNAGAGTITGVTAGADLTGGGTSGSVTLNLDTTKVPLLAAANTFTGNQTVNGNLSATGVVTGSSYQIGNNLFAFGSYANSNAFLGFSGNSAATGGDNTGSGYLALQQLTTGSENTAIGSGALQEDSVAGGNTAIGFDALLYNSGSFNTAIGVAALSGNATGYQNTATGVAALYSNTTGFYNTATGYGALEYNYTASYNTAHGYSALYSNSTGSPNDAFGFEALDSNTVGADNVAVGYRALYSNVGDSAGHGVANTAVGTEALFGNTTGYYNTAVGTLALFGNATGAENTAVGYDALLSNTTGSNLTCVGYDCTTDADGLSNATAIGAHASVGASNSLVLGGTGDYAVKVGIGTTTPSNILTVAQGAGHPVSDSWETYSSRRWKTNIQTLPNGLAKVQQLRGVSYDLKSTGKHEVGVIAEEVGAVVPEVVSYEENGKDARSVDYSRLTALLIEAVKQQQREIRDLKSELRATRETLQKVKAQVDAAQPALVSAR